MARPFEASGDPEAVICRWCERGKLRLRGHSFCQACDSAGDGRVVIQATWDREDEA